VSSFSIPRVSIPASLLLTDGDSRLGEIYVMERVPHHTGPETPLEMLNRAEGFFPFRPAGAGTILLVTRARTITLSVPRNAAGEDPARLSAAKRVGITITLAGDTDITGWATLELPEFHSRLLDYLNASPDPFFAVTTADEIHYVNRAHVLYARPED
jgi:hypothetical protein